ncbi:MAG: signal peptidase I, partial [Candidatus Paceibacteria bacterium]
RHSGLYINGELMPEEYTLEQDPYSDFFETVKPGHYFVLGDNRLHSSDSREFGQVKADYVRGKVDVRLWPLERMGRIR